jgi:hypothetical protein
MSRLLCLAHADIVGCVVRPMHKCTANVLLALAYAGMGMRVLQ